jgi:dienelactone hydrolase
MSNSPNAAMPASPGVDLPTRQDPVTRSHAGQELRAVIHRLQESSSMPRAAVAIVEGLHGDDDHATQALADLADALARVNMVALRLNLRQRAELGFDEQMREAQTALDALSQQPDVDVDHRAIVGSGWSIAAAACLAKHDERVSGVAIWEPMPTGAADRSTGATDQCSRYYQGNGVKSVLAKVLIVQSAAGPSLPTDQAQRMTQLLEQEGILSDVTVIGGADGKIGNSQSRHEAISRTVEWLQSVLIAGE